VAEKITLDFIGAQLVRVLDELGAVRAVLADVKARLQAVETATVELRRSIVDLHADQVRLDHRLDAFGQRLARIERRLDLVEG